MKVTGAIFIGEAAAWAGKASRRLSGQPWLSVWSNVLGGAIAIASIVSMAALQEAGLVPQAGWIVALLVAVVGGIWATVLSHRYFAVRHFRHAMITRGVSNPLSASLEIREGQLLSTLGQCETRAPVAAVSDVAKVGPYWVLTIEGSQSYLPVRHFASPQHEREFLTTLNDGMTEDSRRRSPTLVAALKV